MYCLFNFSWGWVCFEKIPNRVGRFELIGGFANDEFRQKVDAASPDLTKALVCNKNHLRAVASGAVVAIDVCANQVGRRTLRRFVSDWQSVLVVTSPWLRIIG